MTVNSRSASAHFIIACIMAAVGVAALTGSSFAQVGGKKAALVRHPGGKQNISGYIHIALAWGDRLTPPRNLLRGFINLKEGMHRWTKIETRIDSHLFLSSQKLLDMPYVYITTDRSFDLSAVEVKNVKEFFDRGGFMFLETATPATENSQAGASLKKMLRDTLGAHARFQPIPESHEFYHCFFDFDEGPPQGAELAVRGGFMPRQIHYLEGIWYRGRLAAVYSDKGYIVKWNDMDNNIPQLKLGVNSIVYSMIHEGGMLDRESTGNPPE